MIFVTVGTQYPFDRLVAAVDEWAGRSGERVMAQVGDTGSVFANIQARPWLEQDLFHEYCLAADLIVAHGGIGSVLTARQLQKPLLVMPRRASCGEHRDNHQVHFCRRIGELGMVPVAEDAKEVGPWLDRLVNGGYVPSEIPSTRAAVVSGVSGLVHKLLGRGG